MHSFDARFGWWDDRETAIEKALAYADRALEIDPGNADAYTASSLILLFQRQHDKFDQSRVMFCRRFVSSLLDAGSRTGRVMLCRSIIAARAKISADDSLTRKADGIASIASHQEESLDSNPLGPARFCTRLPS